MNDSFKTLIFLVVALLVLIPAIFISLPERESFTSEKMVNQVLFPALKDVMDAASLSIQKVGPTGTLRTMEVKKVGGKWILSSFSGYPANAQNRMVEVVSVLSGLEVLRVVGEDGASRAKCGVLTSEEAPDANPEELGTRITIRNPSDQTIFDLILGHEISVDSGKYYVRRAGQNPVYVVEMNPEPLSVNFIDWIETDLLKVQPSDIASLFALDCTLDPKANADGSPAFNHRGQFTIEQKFMENPDWILKSNLRVFGNGMKELGMPEGKVLALTHLRSVSQALSDMRISSVQRKPVPLNEAFRHPENLNLTEEQNQVLQERGFWVFPMNLGQGVTNTLFSTDGQVHVYSKDGLVYRLFFGGIAGQEALMDLTEVGERKFYRYLVLTVNLFPQSIPQPNLQELPPKPESSDPAALAQYEALLQMNQQEQKIYDEKIAQAQKKAEELNELFADWFFIIPDDVYQKIHLTCENVFISEEEAQKEQEALKESNTAKTVDGHENEIHSTDEHSTDEHSADEHSETAETEESTSHSHEFHHTHPDEN